MEAICHKVTNVRDWDDEPAESWFYFLRIGSMSAAEQEVVRDSNLRTRSGGYSLRREALGAAKIDAEDIQRAVRARPFEV